MKETREALEFALSPEGHGLTGMNVYKALQMAGVIKQTYKTWSDYCRADEAELWQRLQAR